MDYLYTLQCLRESAPQFLNYFFLAISEVILKGGVIMIALIYWCIDKQNGTYIASGYTFSYFLNQTVKNIVCMPRPWLRDSRLHVASLAEKSATGFSFPSGHTVTAASCFGGIAVWKKNNRLIVCLMSLLTLLTAFSRNWLGAHTLADVVTAIFIAAVGLCAVRLFFFWFASHQDKDFLVCAIGIIVSLAILVLLQFKPYNVDNPYPLITDCYTGCGMQCGFFLGWFLERRFVKFSNDGSVSQKIVRGAVGVVILLTLYLCGSKIFGFMGSHLSHLVKYFLLFFFMMYLYPLIFTSIQKKMKKNN